MADKRRLGTRKPCWVCGKMFKRHGVAQRMCEPCKARRKKESYIKRYGKKRYKEKYEKNVR